MFSSEVGYSSITGALSNITNQYNLREHRTPNLAVVVIARPGELFHAIPSCLPETLGWKEGQLPPAPPHVNSISTNGQSWEQKAPKNAEMTL